MPQTSTAMPPSLRLRLYLAVPLLVLGAPAALAQTPGSCALGTAQAELFIGDVRADLFNGSDFLGSRVFGDGYFVSKTSRHSPLFAA